LVPVSVGVDTCTSTTAQIWTTEKSTISGHYVLKNSKGCLSVYNNKPVLLPCNTSDSNQAWNFTRGIDTLSQVVNYNLNKNGSNASLAIANSTLYTSQHGTADIPLPDAAYGINTIEFQRLHIEPPCTARGCEDYQPWQTWYYDPVDQFLRATMYVASINHCYQGDCYVLTQHWPTTTHWCLSYMDSIANSGTPAGTVEVWGGPLANGDYVMGLMNRGTTTANITATWNMLQVSGIGDSTCFTVRDLVAQKSLGNFTGKFSQEIGGHDAGAIRLTKC